MSHELAVVMPVYNEQECIRDVVVSWLDVLSRQDIDFQMIVLNDGSSDGTGSALEGFSGNQRVEVVTQPNSGHGPTILMGYRKAAGIAEWVFQCDSDNEMTPDGFPALWERRHEFDALFGHRAGRTQSPGRRLISAGSRLTVQMLFGKGVTDVNTPYRLIRSAILREIVDQIPPDTFAPNVIISGALARAGARIYNHPVPHEHRKTGSVSIMKWKLWKSAFRSFWQTLRCRPRIENRASRRRCTDSTRTNAMADTDSSSQRAAR